MASAHLQRGNLLTTLQRWGEAEKAFLESLRIDPKSIEAHVHALGARLIDGLQELGATVVTPRAATGRGPLVCVRSTDVGALVAALAAERIVVSSREDKLRIALHLYNVEADVDTLLDALTRNRSLLG